MTLKRKIFLTASEVKQVTKGMFHILLEEFEKGSFLYKLSICEIWLFEES